MHLLFSIKLLNITFSENLQSLLFLQHVDNSILFMMQLKMTIQNKYKHGFLLLWLSKQSTHQIKLSASLSPIYPPCTSPTSAHESG